MVWLSKISLMLSMAFPPGNVKLEITCLTDDFYIYTTYKDLNGYLFPSNSMYLVTNQGVVLFDTPWDTTQVIPLRDSIRNRHGKEISHCIVTHFHDDRTAGLEQLRKMGVITFSSAKTKDMCRLRNEKQAEFTFTKDTVFTIGGHSFESYYPGEGHSADNIIIWFPKSKILYGGCFVKSSENNGLGNIADANVKEWRKSVKKVMRKYPGAEFIIPGHFGWGGNKHLSHTFELLCRKKSKKNVSR